MTLINLLIFFHLHRYCFGTSEERNMKMMLSGVLDASEFEYMKTAEVREKFMQVDDECDDSVDACNEPTPDSSPAGDTL